MSAPAPKNAWIYAVAAVFFLGVGLRDLGLGAERDVPNAVWELTFAVANALFLAFYRGGPAWLKPLATGLFTLGIGIALATILF